VDELHDVGDRLAQAVSTADDRARESGVDPSVESIAPSPF
jgi:hypothetical protein